MNPENVPSQETVAHPSFVRRHRRKLAALCFWLSLLGGYQLYAWRAGLTPLETAQRLVDFMANSAVGGLGFVALYTACPLVLFPVDPLAVIAGFVFGPVKGIILTLLGTTISASFAYLVGRCFGKGLFGSEEATGIAGRYADKMRANGFESVLITRFTFLPFDLINYLAGFLRIGWKPFILASTLGSLPGTVSFVLFGASIEMLGDTPKLDPWTLLAAAVVILAGSLSLSRCLKRRERGNPLRPNPETRVNPFVKDL